MLSETYLKAEEIRSEFINTGSGGGGCPTLTSGGWIPAHTTPIYILLHRQSENLY